MKDMEATLPVQTGKFASRNPDRHQLSQRMTHHRGKGEAKDEVAVSEAVVVARKPDRAL